MIGIVKSHQFWLGAVAGVLILKFVLPKVAPGVAAKLS